MFKIKLLILLLANLTLLSCSVSDINKNTNQFSLAYVGGEVDGLIFKNLLEGYMEGLNLYNKNSNYEIKAEINHNTNLYITNIDNTSDRENITTNLSVIIFNKKDKCQIYKDQLSVSQFYIFASSTNFLSNQSAVSTIKKNNSEALVKELVRKLYTIDKICNEKKSN